MTGTVYEGSLVGTAYGGTLDVIIDVAPQFKSLCASMAMAACRAAILHTAELMGIYPGT